MNQRVQRFIVRAHPAEEHPGYYRWQTATLCVFVGEDDKRKAFEKAKKTIADRRWVTIEFVEKATLIEDRVRSVGGDVWQAYQEALQGKTRLIEIVDQPTTSKGSSPPVLAPKVTEAFVDSVVIKAGGHRYVPTGPQHCLSRNADYLIDDYIFDLKMLEEESLEVVATQNKLADLFASAFPGQPTISLDPALLSPEKRGKYYDIVRKRLQKPVRSASGQIRETKLQIGDERLKGGVILLNSGFGSLHPSAFEEQAKRCAKQDSTQIECVICVSVWLLTNGFDSIMNFKFYPESPQNKTVERLAKAFWEREDEWMTEFARSGFLLPSEATEPMKAIAFERDGIIFSFVPPQIPDERFAEKRQPPA